MDDTSQKSMAKHREGETAFRGLSDRESLSAFRRINRTVLETMLKSNLKDLKKIHQEFADLSLLKNFDLEQRICAEVMKKREKLNEPPSGESNDE